MARLSAIFPLLCLISGFLARDCTFTESQEAPLEASRSEGFNNAAKILKASINEHVDPCEDFFEFACGKWIANNPIPNDKTSIGRFSLLSDKVNQDMKALFEDSTYPTSTSINTVRQIYEACMDTEAINAKKSRPLLQGFAKFDFLPWKFDFTALLVSVAQSQPSSILFSVSAEPDEKNVSRLLLHFDQGGLGLGAGSRDYYLDGVKYAQQMAAYERLMMETIKLVREDAVQMKDIAGWYGRLLAYGRPANDEELLAEVRSIIGFEKQLAAIMTPDAERRNFTHMYHLRRLSDLHGLMPSVDWLAYFTALMPLDMHDMHDYLVSNPEVVIVELDFFQRLERLFGESNPGIYTNYILWRYVQSWSGQLDERYDDIQLTFLKAFTGLAQKPPRWKVCVAAASGLMGYASGAMYVRRYFDRQNMEAAQSLVEDLKQTFIGMLHDNDWMGEETRQLAIEKAKAMLPLVGYPALIDNDTALDEEYANFTLHPTDGYATILSKFYHWSWAKGFRELLEPVDRSEFGVSPATVNAFYLPTKNAIIIPAAVLQSPFFDRSFPKVVNYGGIGAGIGHEITHGFDDHGAQFDKAGNLDNWWDPLTQRKFLNRTKCIIEQYSSYEVPNTGHLHINGILTQGENIADNGGIKQAYKAYRAYRDRQLAGGEEPPLPGLEHYSNDQIFFISFALNWCGSSKPETDVRQVLVDPHSPMRFRVNGVVVNQPEFAKAFSCPVGSPLDTGKSCDVW